MKKVILLLCSIMLSANLAFADSCFIAKEKNQVLKTEGDCDKRYAPMSTFKIVLSLIGFDSDILVDKMNPVWPFKEGYVDWREVWKQDQTPKSWMKESCVWYSQVLTTKLGMKKFQAYVTKFDYGNKDLTGDKGQNNGLTNAWLSSSLQISSTEQVAFLEKMLTGKLPIKPHAVAMTKNILFVEDLKNGWKFYGKTGMGSLLNADGTKNPDLYHGWFIGWIEKGDRRIIFSNHIEDDKKEEIGAS
ncbi:MAG: class D beta-lactamase, partial [Chlamydiae bacterium]|nr:class D beta-lactamase [Chlamydiota bacterium]